MNVSQQNKKIITLFTAVIIFIILSANFKSSFINKSEIVLTSDRIAHGGGSWNGHTLTNSLESLKFNANKGFKLIELDFLWTSDQQLITLHDWGQSFENTFGFSVKKKPDLKTIKKFLQNSVNYHILTLSDLAIWIEKNPQIRIVTDVKVNNFDALELMAKKIPDYSVRIIPQIYQPTEYKAVKNLGYKNIIWTLYQCKEDNGFVLSWVDKIDLFAVTMPRYRARQGLAIELRKKSIPSYVHTINLDQELNEYINKYAITNIYTDTLTPL